MYEWHKKSDMKKDSYYWVRRCPSIQRSKIRKKANRLWNLSNYSKKARVRKKNRKRLERFQEKYNVPAGPIPLWVGGSWSEGVSFSANERCGVGWRWVF